MSEKVIIVPIPAQEDETSEEWGVLFPDGNIDWEGHGFGARYGDLRSREGQIKAQERYDHDRAQVHAVEGGRLRFVKRVVTVSYSLPVVARAIRHKEDQG